MKGIIITSTAIACLFVVATSITAQTVNLWPGVAPGSENWTYKEATVENTPIGTVVLNVTTPTLTAFLPPKDKAIGSGIIIAPGGAFVALAMDIEGNQVARWLQERGIAAFVLKYRLMEKKGEGLPTGMNFDEAAKYGIADAIQAIKIVRQHSNDWGVAPNKVGFIGFSAGAMVSSGTVLQADASARPNIAAIIYGGPFGVMPTIPAQLPPLFLAWAQDDPLVLAPVNKFYEALRAAGHKPELHIYNAGGHGFGMKKQGTSSDHWIDEFYYWLEVQGFTKRS